MKRIAFTTLCFSGFLALSCSNKSETPASEIKKVASGSNLGRVECSETAAEMESVRTCLFYGESIAAVYEKTTTDKDLIEAEWLLKTLPERDTIVHVDQSSLIDLEYTIAPGSVYIEASHQGGVSTISIVKDPKGAKRVVTMSAD